MCLSVNHFVTLFLRGCLFASGHVVSVSVCKHVCQFSKTVCLPASLHACLSDFVCLSVCLSVCLCVYLTFEFVVCRSDGLSMYRCVSVCLCMYVYRVVVVFLRVLRMSCPVHH